MVAQTGLLVLTNLSKVGRILHAVTRHVRNTLYIHLLPEQTGLCPAVSSEMKIMSNPNQMAKVTNMVFGLYSQASVACHNLDVRVLLTSLKDPFVSELSTKRDIDVLILDRVYNASEVEDFMENCITSKAKLCHIYTVDDCVNEKGVVFKRMRRGSEIDAASVDSVIEVEESANVSFHNLKRHYECNFSCEFVVLGGTFDRLHTGHKMLLSEALLRCTKELTVGVTDEAMINSKKLKELIQPYSERIESVRDFLEDVDSTLQYNIVPISDALGPTRDDPKLQMLIVSPETINGAKKVNETRAENGLNGLAVHTIPLLKDEGREAEEEEEKVSSSSGRMRLLGTRLRTPKPKPHLPLVPYIIGLTGGTTSGKSSIATRLEALGAGVISCDKLGHNVYRNGKLCYQRLVKVFGDEILDSELEIDRGVLSRIVFNDQEKLEKLNVIVWPEIFKEIQVCQIKLHEAGKKIIVIDAALLLDAGWDESCHEIWVVFVPPDEAVKRLQARNNLSESDARSRLAAQPPNESRVCKADVVLSTLWSPEYTQQQVERAWQNLHQHLQSIGVDLGTHSESSVENVRQVSSL